MLIFSGCGINYHRSKIRRHWQKINTSLEKHPDLKEEISKPQTITLLEHQSPDYDLPLQVDQSYKTIVTEIVSLQQKQDRARFPDLLPDEERQAAVRILQDSIQSLFKALEQSVYKDTVFTLSDQSYLIVAGDTLAVPYEIKVSYQKGRVGATLHTRRKDIHTIEQKIIHVDASRQTGFFPSLKKYGWLIGILILIILLVRIFRKLLF